jgi:hypothetical protein
MLGLAAGPEMVELCLMRVGVRVADGQRAAADSA